jgi:protein-S-isoprenylcysteine O-methyltransferase Ste14
MKNTLLSIAFFILAPGTFMFVVPIKLAGLKTVFPVFDLGQASYLGCFFIIFGAGIMLKCFWDFVARGNGTPSPSHPPTEFVATGLYRYNRNPMYVGGLVIILGWFLWFGAAALLLWLAFVFMAFHTFVVNFEEPTLRRTFGETYEEYCGRVPRWWLRY